MTKIVETEFDKKKEIMKASELKDIDRLLFSINFFIFMLYLIICLILLLILFSDDLFFIIFSIMILIISLGTLNRVSILKYRAKRLRQIVVKLK